MFRMGCRKPRPQSKVRPDRPTMLLSARIRREVYMWFLNGLECVVAVAGAEHKQGGRSTGATPKQGRRG